MKRTKLTLQVSVPRNKLSAVAAGFPAIAVHATKEDIN